MFGKSWSTSERKYPILVENNVRIKTRDGTELNADIYRPSTKIGDKFPALLGIHPYLPIQSPPIKPKANSTTAGGWAAAVERPNSPMESGDPEFYARRGYAHVICNVRGTGQSEGIYDFVGPKEVQDVHDVIEWIAKQSWCDGNIGMFGVSYFAWMQQFVATSKPPHLKCIFGPYAATDFYRDVVYHGGILSLWALNWKKLLDNVRAESKTAKELGPRLKQAIEEALQNDELRSSLKVLDALKNPEFGDNPVAVDLLLHPFDDEFWHERQVDCSKINIPAYLGADWAIYGLHLPGAFRSWEKLKVPKMMTIGPPVNLDRPVYQLQYESLRWFDHWLKGMDTGIMDEPPIKLYVMGSQEWKYAKEWPLPETKWTPFFLHESQLLSEHEFWPNEMFDTYEDSPWGRGNIEYYTPTMVEKTEVVGPLVLNLFASSTDNEILWLVSLRDVDPDLNETILTRGWLRGSHRLVDQSKSALWYPYHPHTRAEPLEPNQVYEFNISLVPTANLFKEGHKIAIKISSVDDPPKNTFEGIASEHVRRQRASRITIYHDAEHPSHLLLPITSGNLIGTFMSGGRVNPVN